MEPPTKIAPLRCFPPRVGRTTSTTVGDNSLYDMSVLEDPRVGLDRLSHIYESAGYKIPLPSPSVIDSVLRVLYTVSVYDGETGTGFGVPDAAGTIITADHVLGAGKVNVADVGFESSQGDTPLCCVEVSRICEFDFARISAIWEVESDSDTGDVKEDEDEGSSVDGESDVGGASASDSARGSASDSSSEVPNLMPPQKGPVLLLGCFDGCPKWSVGEITAIKEGGEVMHTARSCPQCSGSLLRLPSSLVLHINKFGSMSCVCCSGGVLLQNKSIVGVHLGRRGSKGVGLSSNVFKVGI